jgi:hypothetical protein
MRATGALLSHKGPKSDQVRTIVEAQAVRSRKKFHMQVYKALDIPTHRAHLSESIESHRLFQRIHWAYLNSVTLPASLEASLGVLVEPLQLSENCSPEPKHRRTDPAGSLFAE